MKHKTKGVLLFVIISVCSMLTILVIVLNDSYQYEKRMFVSNVEQVLNKSVLELNHSAATQKPKGDNVISTRGDSLYIVKQGILSFVILANPENKAEFLNRAMYDMREPELWTLDNLYKKFRERIGRTIPPSVFILQDSSGKRLEVQKRNLEDIPAGKNGYVIPLGFIEKHSLTAYFDFTLLYFLTLEWDKVAIILILLLMLVVCIANLVGTIRKERLKLEQQELFTQTLNHDLSSPIRAMMMNQELIRMESKEPYSEMQQKYYDIAELKGKEILDSIDCLLRNAVDEKGLKLKLDCFNLHELISRIASGLFIPKDKKVDIQLEFRMENNENICADNYHLKRAVENLLNNAVKYSGTNVNIIITCIRAGEMIFISVKDDGVGIFGGDARHIFERNFRSRDTTTNKVIHGYGLGLSYVKMVAEAHKGSVMYVKGEESGSEFIIKLKQ